MGVSKKDLNEACRAVRGRLLVSERITVGGEGKCSCSVFVRSM